MSGAGPPGLIAVASAQAMYSVPSSTPVAAAGESQLVYVEASGSVEALALQIVATESCEAAVLHWGGAFASASLPLAFAMHLRALRVELGIRVQRCITSAIAPSPPDANSIRVPHLVAATDGQRISDTTVWELMPTAAARDWFGRPLPERLDWIEKHLARLMHIRALVRDGQLPQLGRLAELPARLAGGYLSIRFVLHHADFFEALLTDEALWRELGI